MQAEVRLYDRLWKVENPRDELAAIREAKNCDALEAMKDIINPDSLKVLPNCYIEKFAGNLAHSLIPAIPTDRLFQYRQRINPG